MAGQMAVYGGGGAASVGGSNTNSILLQNRKVHGSCEAFDSMFLSGSSPSFLGSGSMVSFEDVNGRKRSGQFFFSTFDQEENVDEELDEYFHQHEKKRRLKPDQVQFLEKNFEVDNKLEPERKIRLAKDLGLQPRQVAIWFQNRRARWKTKLLEIDYGALQASYNNLKTNYEGLLKEKEKLKAEVLQLTNKLRRKEKGNLESSKTKKQSQAAPRVPISDSVPEDELSNVSTEREGKTDYIDGDYCSLLEPGDSSYVFEPDQSDLSQDEEDNFSKSMLPPMAYMFPKIEDADYPALPANSCCFGLAVEDYTFGFWS